MQQLLPCPPDVNLRAHHQRASVQVSDIVSGLEAEANSPAASPAAGPVPSPAPSEESFSASWGKVANAFNQLIHV